MIIQDIGLPNCFILLIFIIFLLSVPIHVVVKLILRTKPKKWDVIKNKTLDKEQHFYKVLVRFAGLRRCTINGTVSINFFGENDKILGSVKIHQNEKLMETRKGVYDAQIVLSTSKKLDYINSIVIFLELDKASWRSLYLYGVTVKGEESGELYFPFHNILKAEGTHEVSEIQLKQADRPKPKKHIPPLTAGEKMIFLFIIIAGAVVTASFFNAISHEVSELWMLILGSFTVALVTGTVFTLIYYAYRITVRQLDANRFLLVPGYEQLSKLPYVLMRHAFWLLILLAVIFCMITAMSVQEPSKDEVLVEVSIFSIYKHCDNRKKDEQWLIMFASGVALSAVPFGIFLAVS